MTDVFISYKQDEREAVQIIADSLADLRVDCWFDTRLRAGGSFDEEIAAALDKAKAVLVCWTPAAVNSEWVRGEATKGHEIGRLVACFLQPTSLPPPFNLVHSEDLCAWAGQPDAPQWLKVLDSLGEKIGRPGLATYQAVMRPSASLQELKAWAGANGDDPLVDQVWARIQLLEGEGASDRIDRQRREARVAAAKRKAQTERSARLRRERGLRDPARERRRWLALVGSVVFLALVAVGAITYFTDVQARDRDLRDNRTSVAEVRAFLHENSWHPISGRAREKLTRLDAAAWASAQGNGSIEALEMYVAGAEPEPQGAFLAEARAALDSAGRVRRTQELLRRMRFYEGDITGAYDRATRDALRLFRFRRGVAVSDTIDDDTVARVEAEIPRWIHPRLEELYALHTEPPTEADYMRIAEAINVDAPTIFAVIDVEAPRNVPAFQSDGRMLILFERHLFSRKTQRRYDDTHPNVSNPRPGGYPVSQEERWEQLAAAFALDEEAALQSTSYGRFQVLGQNYASLGFETAGEYVRFISESEANQIYAALVGFVRQNGLTDELQRHDWAGFANGYNGSIYAQLGYDTRLRDAFNRHAARLGLLPTPPAPTSSAPALVEPSE